MPILYLCQFSHFAINNLISFKLDKLISYSSFIAKKLFYNPENPSHIYSYIGFSAVNDGVVECL